MLVVPLLEFLSSLILFGDNLFITDLWLTWQVQSAGVLHKSSQKEGRSYSEYGSIMYRFSIIGTVCRVHTHEK